MRACVCVCVCVCDQETSKMRRPWPALGRSANKKNNNTHAHSSLTDFLLTL